MYTIKEISDLLQVSKVTLYKKLKLKEMEQYIVKRNSVTYVDSKGLEVLRGLLTLKEEFTELNEELKEVKSEAEKEVAATVENEEFKGLTDDYINHLKGENTKLWNQIEEKDKQIEELLNRIESMSKLVENSQVLLREKAQDPLQLEERFENIQSKLEEVKDKMNQRHEEKKGFWNRLKK